MDVRIQADAVAVGRALIAALLFVSERVAPFSEAKFDDTVFGRVINRWRTHSTSFSLKELTGSCLDSRDRGKVLVQR
jgi:hypothetical protein